MNKLKTVFSFEFNELIKKKAMIISTLVVAVILFGITFAPRLIGFFDKEEVPGNEPDISVISPFGDSVITATSDELLEYAKNALSGFDDISFSNDVEATKKRVQDKEIDAAYILDSKTSFSVVKIDQDMYSTDASLFLESTLFEMAKNENFIAMGINPEDANNAENIKIDVEYIVLGKEQSQGIVIGFVVLFSLYMMILMYGQLVATSVAREKDNRTMELLITSTKPQTLILGKVFAAGLVGFIQVLFIIFMIVLGFLINKGTYPEFVIEMIKASTAWDVVLVYGVFSFVGYLLYLFIYAALGSLVSKVEDVGSAVSSITIVFVIAYLIASSAMGNPESLVVKVSSYIPFVSLFTTPIRYNMTSVGFFELAMSLTLLISVTTLIAYLSIYIYRLGSLNYGNKMSLIKIIKNMFSKSK